jgi:hypothetical protein
VSDDVVEKRISLRCVKKEYAVEYDPWQAILN